VPHAGSSFFINNRPQPARGRTIDGIQRKRDTMSFASLAGWIACGLVAGLTSQFVVPGRETTSLPMTIVLGIAGAIAGGVLFALVQGFPAAPLSLSQETVFGWLVAVLGATVLLWVYPFVHPRGWPR
jgi:uncharacterized membrane protein YeaQ/YmgE (transglycosylase-associated protein family)